MINEQNYLICTILQLKYKRKTLQTKQTKTHNSFLINDQILFEAQFLEVHKHKKVYVALSLVDNGFIASSWFDGLQKIEMCWANQQQDFTVDGHATLCRGKGRYGESLVASPRDQKLREQGE
jgi:hypothetical protein